MVYQNNLQSEDKAYFAIEKVDADKALNVLTEASIPVNGTYGDPMEIMAHEKAEEFGIEDEDTKLSVINQLYEGISIIMDQSWGDIVGNVEALEEAGISDEDYIPENDNDDDL